MVLASPAPLKPRPEATAARVVRRWRFEDSVFSKYHEDNDALLDKAFLRDWQYTKVPRLVARTSW
jgi:hypothetical protein